jgi:uncharacterized repeat protein (TIGR03806 family)
LLTDLVRLFTRPGALFANLPVSNRSAEEPVPMRRWFPLGLALLLCLPFAPSAVPAPPADPWRGPYPDDPDLPEGFSDTLVASGITGATALAVAPDGRVFVGEQTGTLRVIKDDRLLPEPFVTLPVDSFWERGLIGVCLDPDFLRKPFVYVCYVVAKPYPHHVISRFTAKGDVAEPSEVILLEGDDQRKLGGAQPAGHQGGAVHFGKDGKLYVAIGEQTAGAPAQRLDTFQGKLLRINPDGSIPEDNPFFKEAKGKYRAIWALGLRNPFAFAVQPGTGRIFINDVGNARIEEVNEGFAGANYGWPESEGPTANPKHRGPIHAYDHRTGRSITGGTFYNPPVAQFPKKYVGNYFFLDFMDHWMRVLDPDRPESAEVFATGLAGPVDVATAPDGSLYYLNRKEWVKDERFQKGTGALHKITYGRGGARVTRQPADALVAEGGKLVLTVWAKGAGPLRYRWQRDGKPIPGAESDSYKLDRVTAADDSAEFRCVVSTPTDSTRSRRATLRVLPLRDAARVTGAGPGLEYRLYEGRWAAIPDFDALQPVKTGTAGAIDVGAITRREGAGIVWRGFLEAQADGVYTFFLDSPGASKLFVGSAQVALTTGARPGQAQGSVALRAGKHALLLLFAQAAGKPELRLHYAGPDFDQRPIPETRLSHGGATPSGGRAGRDLVTALNVPADPADLPPLLSQTGAFRSLADLAPSRGLVPYDVNSPLWSDGAAKRRWIALPGDERVTFSPTGEWKFPRGTVFVKHFELEGRRLETRFLVVADRGGGYGVTYRWRTDGKDADLLSDGVTEDLTVSSRGEPRRLKWTYPSRNDCLACHTTAAGFVLGVKARQLNGPFKDPEGGDADNQLRTWSRLGLLRNPPKDGDIARLDKLAAVTDKGASPEQRVRSYLDANCAHCHRPGGARGLFDARFDVPLGRQNIVNGEVTAADLGVPGARLVAPGDPAKSMLYQRMNRRRDVFNMPPIATHEIDREAVGVVEEWIRSLSPRRD